MARGEWNFLLAQSIKEILSKTSSMGKGATLGRMVPFMKDNSQKVGKYMTFCYFIINLSFISCE